MMFPSDQRQYIKQVTEAQERINDEVGKIRVEASTGAGMVTVRMDGFRRMLSVSIAPDAVSDVEMLEDLVRSACNEAGRRAEAEMKRRVGGLMSSLMLGMPGLGQGPS